MINKNNSVYTPASPAVMLFLLSRISFCFVHSGWVSATQSGLDTMGLHPAAQVSAWFSASTLVLMKLVLWCASCCEYQLLWLGVHLLWLGLLEKAFILSTCITPSFPPVDINQPCPCSPQNHLPVTCQYVHLLLTCRSQWLSNCLKCLWISTVNTSPESLP